MTKCWPCSHSMRLLLALPEGSTEQDICSLLVCGRKVPCKLGHSPECNCGQPGRQHLLLLLVVRAHTDTAQTSRDQYPCDAVPRKLIRMRPRPNEPGRCGAKRRRAELFDEIKEAQAPILALPPDLLIQVSLQDWPAPMPTATCRGLLFPGVHTYTTQAAL